MQTMLWHHTHCVCCGPVLRKQSNIVGHNLWSPALFGVFWRQMDYKIWQDLALLLLLIYISGLCAHYRCQQSVKIYQLLVSRLGREKWEEEWLTTRHAAARSRNAYLPIPLPRWVHRGGSSWPWGRRPVSKQDKNASMCPPLGKWIGGRWTPSWPTRTNVPPLSAEE